MASPPAQTRFSLDQVPAEARKVLEHLVPSLNQFTQATTAALTKGLRLSENADAQVHTFRRKVLTAGGGLVAIAKRGTSQNINDASATIVDFATVESDSTSSITTGASWKFTASRAMTISVSCSIQFDFTLSSGTCQARLYKNGSEYARLSTLSTAGASDGNLAPSGTRVLTLAAGDYIDIRAFQNSGGTLTITADALVNHVSIVEIGGAATTAACWPYDFVCTTKGKPKFVLVACHDANDPHRTVTHYPPAWTVFEKEGKRFIRIKDISGLTASRNYEIDVLVLAG